MDVLGGTGRVELNLFRTQMDEERQVRALASGLRVQSAADDPSGLAISETIQTKVGGLQQGVQNVQNAGNVLNVADGALAAVSKILERVHSLIVEAHSDLNSNEQLESIQTEIDQLLHEIDQIGEKTQFNGLRLLTGAFDSSPATLPQAYVITSEPNANGTIAATQVVNYDGLGNAGPLLPDPGTGPSGSQLPVLLEVRVLSYTSDVNATDPDTGATVGPSDLLSIVQYSNDPSFGNGQQENDSTAIAVNSGEIPSPNAQLTSPNNVYITYQGGLANLTSADVGVAETILTTTGTSAGTGSEMQINSGGTEGSTVTLQLPTVNSTALGIAQISVLAPTVVNYQNIVQGTTSNTYATDDAEARVSIAQDTVNQARAQIGAQTVALGEDANDASIQIVDQIASESAIRDVNIGQAASAFTRDQILSQAGMSVLAQMQTNAQSVAMLVIGPGGNPSPRGSSSIGQGTTVGFG